MRGSLQQNADYCRKEEHHHKLGDEPQQGERNDTIGFKGLINTGLHPCVVVETEMQYNAFAKFSSAHEKYWNHMQRNKHKSDHKAPIVYIRIGQASVGKTKWAYENNRPLFDMPDLTCKWAGSYSGQPTFLFDDVGAG